MYSKKMLCLTADSVLVDSRCSFSMVKTVDLVGRALEVLSST